MTEKFKKLLSKIPSMEKEVVQAIKEELIEDPEFIEFCNNQYNWTSLEHDGLLRVLELNKNTNGYFMDIYGQRMSYNGIRTLKKAHTEVPKNDIHKNEIDKCKKDFKYFRKYYCFITTKTGLARPEPRHYQEELEDELLTLEDLVVLFPRQSGKCLEYNTNINIKNKKTGEVMEMTIGIFHELIKKGSKT